MIGQASCELLVDLSCPLGGIVACSVARCGAKVTHHALYRTSRGLRLLDDPIYLCQAHRPHQVHR